MKPILILGAGPAGMMAANACKLSGQPFSIVSLGDPTVGPTKSVIGGAQFVHVAVPGVMESGVEEGHLTYHVVGDHVGYKQKVYGAESDIPFVSMQNVLDGLTVDVWSIQKAYDRLWDDIGGRGNSINVETVTPQWLIEQIEADRWKHIVSTIPRPRLCLAQAGLVDGVQHKFLSQRIQIMNECMLTIDPDMGNHIWYDGTDNVSWYRTSMIFGNGSTEWGESIGEKKLPYHTVDVRKPISNNCQCFNGNVLFTGRFGSWRKGLLIHHAFTDTWKLLNP